MKEENKMNIRKALNKDIDVIARYNYNLAYETENKILNMNILTKGVEAIIKDENKGIYHVCEINGEVVGQIMYTFEWSDWRNGTFLWIQSVYVNKEFRGMGVFKALYKFIRDIADNDNNICGIRLYVEKENTIAKKTYKNIGMKECNYYIYEYDKE
jgi:ribosomal protein S18 acetylase RimI-like enzyme